MTESHARRGLKGTESGSATKGFSGPVGVMEVERDGGEGDGQSGDVRDGVEVFSA